MTEAANELAVVRELKGRNKALADEVQALKGGGGGGTLPPMDIVDAKIAASEARADAKFAKVEGKLDLILEKMSNVQSNNIDARAEARNVKRTIITTGISIGALIIALFALFTNGFNVGSKMADVSRQTYVDMSPASVATAPSIGPNAGSTAAPLRPSATPSSKPMGQHF